MNNKEQINIDKYYLEIDSNYFIAPNGKLYSDTIIKFPEYNCCFCEITDKVIEHLGQLVM